MEHNWNKKRIAQLNNADPKAIEQWLDQYVDIIYTWLYFQVGADADIAADLTGRTFTGALRALDQFNPDQQKMLQWLREQAGDARDEGLLHWQMKPQRPWAWSQLPDNILCGLSLLRNEPLAEEVPNNPFVQEMVQAALAEMEQTNRLLMMHRYNHLDTPEHIANEIGISIEEINNRLYSCRHFFRKVLVQLIQSENPGFAEPPASGNLELLDTNLEKLLSSTDMVQHISDKHRAIIREKLLEAARDVTQTKNEETGKNPSAVVIIAGVGVLLLIGIIIWINSSLSESVPEPTPEVLPISSTQVPEKVILEPKDTIDEEELKRVLLLGQTGDLRGLFEILKNGQFTSQIAAANFIGRLGDESAIGLLEESEAKWYPNGSDDNPFSQAIVLIENRLLEQEEVVIEEPNKVETPTPTKTSSDVAPKEAPPAITGTVIDYSGQPVPNASITLSENPLYQDAPMIKTFDQTQTNNEGLYRFPKHEGAIFLDCKPLPNDNQTITQSVWCSKESDCQINFGGAPVISGVLNFEPESAAEQILYLSNTLNPADASFRVETVTDSEGQFSFIGISPDSYYLLNNTESNHIVWLSSVDISQQDTVYWEVTIQRATLEIQFESPENTPPVTAVSLAYGTDVSEEMHQFALQQQEGQAYSLENIPFGSYTLIAQLENGMRLQQPLELNSDRTLTITIPEGTASLSGNFSGQSPSDFFLYNSNQRLRFDLLPGSDRFYSIESVPPDTYTLATIVNNLQLDLLEIDIQPDTDQALDIDVGQLLGDLSPLYVVVTSPDGRLINGAQVWVTGPGDVVTTQSTGRGAFLALRPGEYILHAALPGFSTAEKKVEVKSALLVSMSASDNTVHLQLNTGQSIKP